MYWWPRRALFEPPWAGAEIEDSRELEFEGQFVLQVWIGVGARVKLLHPDFEWFHLERTEG